MKAILRRALVIREFEEHLPAFVLVLVLMGCASVVQGQPIDVAAVEKLIEHTVEEKQLVGLSVGIMSSGRLLLAEGYGVRSLASREPVTRDTMFAIGSVTKQFTCAALMILAEENKLYLTD